MTSYRANLQPAFNNGALNGKPAHAGLVLSRYYPGDVSENKEKGRFLEQASLAVKNTQTIYQAAFSRWKTTIGKSPAYRSFDVKTQGRLAIGLGIESPIEVGLRLHHTYGTPIIPGSSLKGVAAHYCHDVWGKHDERFMRGQEQHRVLFGTTAEAGAITFEDAWIVPLSLPNSMELDVMTPHHSKYYTGDGSSAPTDFDMPIPVPFLSIKGSFLIALEVEKGAEAWGELAEKLLREALKRRGVGGKTRAGYGRLS